LSVTLPDVVGRQRAADLRYTGRRLGGTEAGSIGLVEGLDSGLIEEHQLPLRPHRVQPSRLMRMKLALMGTPWDMPVTPKEREKA